MEALLPTQSGHSLLEICIAPCITAHAKQLSEYVIGFSLLGQYNKFEMFCKKLVMAPAMDDTLPPQARFFQKLINVAPVLSCLALLDIQRLQTHTFIESVSVPKINERYKQTSVMVPELMGYGTLVTWFIWAHVLRITSILDGDISPAMYFLMLFTIELYRFLEIQEAEIFQQEEGIFESCPLEQFKRAKEEHALLTGHDCAICQLEPIGSCEWVYRLPCKHQFHRWCLLHWLVNMGNSCCPLCRDVILDGEICVPAWAHRDSLMGKGNEEQESSQSGDGTTSNMS